MLKGGYTFASDLLHRQRKKRNTRNSMTHIAPLKEEAINCSGMCGMTMCVVHSYDEYSNHGGCYSSSLRGLRGWGPGCGTLKAGYQGVGGGSTLNSWAPSLVGETARTTPTLLHGRVGSRLKWGFKSMQTEPRGSEFQWGMSFFF